MFPIILEKATYKPGNMSWTLINSTNARSAGGTQKQDDTLPWFVYMERKLDGSGGCGRICMIQSGGRRG